MSASRAVLRAAAVLTLALALAPIVYGREVAPLHDGWEYLVGDARARPDPGAAWQPTALPSILSWRPDGPHGVWYRKTFSLPPAWRGDRVVLHLDGVKYSHVAYVNGREVGRHVGGYEPVAYDVTEHATFAGPNELLVAVEDWTALVAPDAMAPPPDRATEFPSWIQDGILAPIGSRGFEVGIWQDVYLEARPAVWVKDVFVAPSVREQRLRVQVTVRNDGPDAARETIAARVADGGPGPALTPRTIALGPDEETAATFEVAWPDAQLWWPESPHLYTLVVSTGSDEERVRFGFREFWVERAEFILNGRPINLLATAAHPMSEYDDNPKRAYALARSAGCVAMRLHAQPWPKQWYEAADEAGMLLIWESALWCLSPNYALTRDEFWRNARAHIEAQVKALRNHPSIVIWSAENELLHCGGDRVEGTETKLGDLADLIRSLDPTRPVNFDGDADPAGKADVVNLHYPHEFPRWNLWPETAYWLEGPALLDAYPGVEWQWSREKPLYLGEFLWVPARDADAASLFFGDAAYPEVGTYHRRAKALAWQAQIIAARDAGVDGLCPWNLWEMGPFPNIGYDAHKRAYQAVAAFPVESSTRFFAGEPVERTFTVLNDSGATRDMELRWRLAPSQPEHGDWQVTGAQSVVLDTAGRRRVQVRLAIPEIERAVVPATFTVELWDGDRRVFSESHEWKLYRRAELSGPLAGAPQRVALYDPKGETTRLLGELSLSCRPLNAANAASVLADVDVAVMGKNAFDSPGSGAPVVGAEDDFAARLLRFAESGGVVIVFEQEVYPGVFPPAALTSHASTIAFRRHATHPILAGIESADLAHWRPDGIVARREIAKPDRGGFVALVDSGGADGLATAGLAEVQIGRGLVLLCQLDVTRKFAVDPVATQIVRAMLRCAAEPAEQGGATAAVCDDRVAGKLDGIGLRYERLTGSVSNTDLRRYRQLLVSDPAWAAANQSALRRFVRSGGRVVLHGLTPETAAVLRDLLGESPALYAGGDGRVSLIDRGGPAVGISNDVLAWFSPSFGPFSTPSLLPDIARHTVQRPYREDGVRARVEAETMEVSGSATDPAAEGMSAALYSNGDMVTRIAAPKAGPYALTIRARGSAAEGAYPRLDIVIDDAVAGSVSPASDQWQDMTTLVTMSVGEHTLRLAFVNDIQTATEDRNVWVDRVEWAPATMLPTSLVYHTTPGVLVSKRDGAGLWVVDQVRWEQAEQNEEKAARYVAALLTALGCSFDHEAGQSLDAVRMTVTDAQLWQETDGSIAFATNGVLEAEVEFGSDGIYGFALRASGTPLDGIYPLVEARIDGAKVGEFQLTSGNSRTYRLRAPVEAGVHRVSLHFVNDASQPPQDRNLTANRLTIWKERQRP